MSTSDLQKCTNVNADTIQSLLPADHNVSSAYEEHVGTVIDTPTTSTNFRKWIEVAISAVTLVLLVFQGMTFAFPKQADESLQTHLEKGGFGTNTESKSVGTAPANGLASRRSLSIAH